MNHYHESPQVLNDFLSYIQTIKGSSPKTVKEYYLDLRMFFRYIKQKRGEVDDIPFDEIPIKDIDIAYIKTITLSDAYDFLMYTVQDRPKHMNSDNSEIGLMAASRARRSLPCALFSSISLTRRICSTTILFKTWNIRLSAVLCQNI